VYTLENIEELAHKLDSLHAEYTKLRQDLIESILGEDLKKCTECKRPMIPRRTWDEIDIEVRKLLWCILTCDHSKGRCRTCISYMHRKSNNTEGTLSEAELANLRRLATGRVA
jgi:hypothetical protein